MTLVLGVIYCINSSWNSKIQSESELMCFLPQFRYVFFLYFIQTSEPLHDKAYKRAHQTPPSLIKISNPIESLMVRLKIERW